MQRKHEEELAKEEAKNKRLRKYTTWRIRDRKVLLLSLIYFLMDYWLLGLCFWDASSIKFIWLATKCGNGLLYPNDGCVPVQVYCGHSSEAQ